jgi:hypothetical protein
MTSEHRHHRRFRVREDAFAVLQTEPVLLMPIYDISLGGLAVGPADGKALIPEASKVEILVADCSFFLDNLPCSLVAARRLPEERGDGQTLWSLKFGSLDNYQLSQLKTFIRTYAVGSVIAPLFLKHHKFLDQFGSPEPVCFPSFQDHSR